MAVIHTILPGLRFISVDVDLGSDAAWDGLFTINDPSLLVVDHIVIMQVPNGDDAEWDELLLSAVSQLGSVTVTWQAVPGPVAGVYSFQYARS